MELSSKYAQRNLVRECFPLNRFRLTISQKNTQESGTFLCKCLSLMSINYQDSGHGSKTILYYKNILPFSVMGSKHLQKLTFVHNTSMKCHLRTKISYHQLLKKQKARNEPVRLASCVHQKNLPTELIKFNLGHSNQIDLQDKLINLGLLQHIDPQDKLMNHDLQGKLINLGQLNHIFPPDNFFTLGPLSHRPNKFCQY